MHPRAPEQIAALVYIQRVGEEVFIKYAYLVNYSMQNDAVNPTGGQALPVIGVGMSIDLTTYELKSGE